MIENILTCLRLRERDARVEAREDVHPVLASFLVTLVALERAAHRDRHEEVGLVAECRALEARGPDADDAKDLAVHGHRLSEHRWIAAELVRPVRVAQYYVRIRADDFILIGPDEAPKRWLHSEHREIRPRHILGAHVHSV